MATLILFNKPFNVLCQFSRTGSGETLADYIDLPGVYPAGRLDKDSEGLVLLTDDGPLQAKISNPRYKMEKTYWVQVEGNISPGALAELCQGVRLKEGLSLPAKARAIEAPLPPRDPPIRFRQNIPTSWLELKIRQGKNRQVRRMTAAVGFPTLRLYRQQIGVWQLGNLKPGQYKVSDL